MKLLRFINIGRVYKSLGDMQKALEKFNEALPIIRAVGDPRRSDTLLGIARVEQKRGNLTQARRSIEQAISIVESSAPISTPGASRFLLRLRQEYYESYINILMEQHKQNPAAGFDAAAFAVSERARARSLLELLTESRIDIVKVLIARSWSANAPYSNGSMRRRRRNSPC